MQNFTLPLSHLDPTAVDNLVVMGKFAYSVKSFCISEPLAPYLAAMKVTNLDERIHVLDGNTDAQTVVRNICLSGVQEEAFYVFDIGDVVRKHKEWNIKLPRVEPYYAVKCNDNQTVLEVLAALGTGFDCASKAEINKVLDVGVDASRIIFANPAKPASHIRHAAAQGVDLMTFDNETELHKVKALHPGARLVIRIRCDAKVAQCQLGMKFGCDAECEAPGLLETAHSLGLEVVGVSFHVGSGCGDPPVFRRAIAAARSLFDLGTKLGFNMDVLDLGGGYPGNKGTSIDKIAEVVNAALADFFPSPDVHIIAEPGRYFVASAYTLATSIHSKREIRSKGLQEMEHVMYYINDGVYGSFNSILYDHASPVPVPLTDAIGKIPSSVWGPTCDGLDQVNDNILLPLLHVGDWLIYEDMGAYTLPVASTFNGFPVPKVRTVVDEAVWMVMKDILPLTESHFTIGNISANLCIGLDINSGDMEDWTVGLPTCRLEENGKNAWEINGKEAPHGPAAKSFLFDFIQVGPVN